MIPYVAPGAQLVLEMYVRDIRASLDFYLDYGFELVRDEGNFVALKWEDAGFFLEQIDDAAPPPPNPVGNLRIMVPDVDAHWDMAREKGAAVIKPIGDREYGLRDFTIAGPDGVALRFGTWR